LVPSATGEAGGAAPTLTGEAGGDCEASAAGAFANWAVAEGAADAAADAAAPRAVDIGGAVASVDVAVSAVWAFPADGAGAAV
jgi:hypothetical protein